MTPPPPRLFTARELAQRVGLRPRTIRLYVAQRLLPAVPFRGPATMYGSDHLLRVRAIRHLRAQRYSTDEIRRELAQKTSEQLAVLVGPDPAEPAPTSPTTTTATSPGAPLAPSSASWERVQLVPGLELHVRSDGGALVRRLAAEIVERYTTATD